MDGNSRSPREQSQKYYCGTRMANSMAFRGRHFAVYSVQYGETIAENERNGKRRLRAPCEHQPQRIMVYRMERSVAVSRRSIIIQLHFAD